MIASLIAEWLTVGVLIAGGVVGLIKWLGRIDRYGEKVDRNTEATEKLTETFEVFSDRVSLRLDDHEVRLRVLESKGENGSVRPVQPN